MASFPVVRNLRRFLSSRRFTRSARSDHLHWQTQMILIWLTQAKTPHILPRRFGMEESWMMSSMAT